MCGDSGIEVAEDEQDGDVRCYFFEDAQIVDLEQVESHLLRCSLFDEVENWGEEDWREGHFATGYPFDYFGERAEGRVQNHRAHFVGIEFGEHYTAETAHAAAPED